MSHLNAQIVRLYDTVFDRAPDAGGLEFWNNASHTGFGLRDLATFFISAPEFASTYGEPTNRGFVEAMYRNVLDRPGEAEGVSFWTNALNAGLADRPQVVVGFSESAEHVQIMAGPGKQAPPAQPPIDHAALDMTTLPETKPGPYGLEADGRPTPKDFYSGTLGPVLVGGEGFDQLFGLGARDAVMWGQGGNDQLQSWDTNDTMHGGPGDDTLGGGAGNDVLTGGPGNDMLTGGPGADVFRFGPGSGNDTITDFERGDRIEFAGITPERVGMVNVGTKSTLVFDGDLLAGDGTIWFRNQDAEDAQWVREAFIFA